MSHFPVAVFSKDGFIEDLLAPYYEELIDGFHAVTEDESEMEEIQAKFQISTGYNSIEEYMENHYNYVEHEGNYGYWYNTQAKWDWYVVGGRWSGFWTTKNGRKCDTVKISKLSLNVDKEAHQKAIRFWEVAVEGLSILPQEKEESFRTIFKPSYYIDAYHSKEEFAMLSTLVLPFAFITEEGEWIARGEVGYFGIDDSTYESSMAYSKRFYEYLKQVPQEWFITIVDCHI